MSPICKSHTEYKYKANVAGNVITNSLDKLSPTNIQLGFSSAYLCSGHIYGLSKYAYICYDLLDGFFCVAYFNVLCFGSLGFELQF